MSVCAYVRVCLYVCVFVCLSVSMYVCMYVCLLSLFVCARGWCVYQQLQLLCIRPHPWLCTNHAYMITCMCMYVVCMYGACELYNSPWLLILPQGITQEGDEESR